MNMTGMVLIALLTGVAGFALAWFLLSFAENAWAYLREAHNRKKIAALSAEAAQKDKRGGKDRGPDNA